MVTLIYGNDIRPMVQRLLAETRALDAVRPQHTVVIKPNLVVSRRDWQGVNTDPRVIAALVEGLKQRDVARITIADGSGMGYSATKAFALCGYAELAQRYGVRLIDLERDRFVKQPVRLDGPFQSLEIAQTVLDCDFLINVPVMKAHSMTLITCSLKNLKGVMPRAMKTAFHGRDLHKAIAQLNSILTPHLILVDGMQGDLASETGHTPVNMERLLLGTNPVEVDSVVADMLGYAPRDIRHLVYSADAGLGTCELGQIEIRALNQPTTDEHFRPPRHYTQRFPCQIHAEGACCTCLGNLLFALERLQAQGLLSKRQTFLVGQKPAASDMAPGLTIAVGRCAARGGKADITITTCPPSAGTIYQRVAAAV